MTSKWIHTTVIWVCNCASEIDLAKITNNSYLMPSDVSPKHPYFQRSYTEKYTKLVLLNMLAYLCWPKYILLNCNCSDKSTSNNSFLWRCTNNQRKPIFKTALFLLIQLLFSLALGYYGIIQYIRGIGREKSCNFIIYFVVKLNQQVYFAYRK